MIDEQMWEKGKVNLLQGKRKFMIRSHFLSLKSELVVTFSKHATIGYFNMIRKR